MPHPPTRSRTFLSYAKINLTLRVAPPRKSGLHPISSWMHSIEFCDELTVSESSTGQSEFSIRWGSGEPVEWAHESDLVVRAHALLEARFNRSFPVDVRLSKSIPAGGGLGGGSSNAATILMVINQLFQIGMDEQQLQGVAHSLGSDIPYFIDLGSFVDHLPPRPAIVSGVGERISRVRRSESEITLLIPSFGCPTRAIFDEFDQRPVKPMMDTANLHDLVDREGIESMNLVNDLYTPARRAVPKLAAVLDRLDSLGVRPKLSGSGSTMYLLGRLDQDLESSIRRAIPELSVHSTRLI